MKMSVALLSAFLLASPAFAQTSGGVMSGSGAVLEGGSNDVPENASAGGENEDGERRICRRVEGDSHTRMSTRRVCLTAREWREQQRRN